MSGIQLYSLTNEQFSEHLTSCKNLVLDKLLDDKIITEEQHKHYSMNYGVLVAKGSFFSEMWDKILGDSKDTNKMILVKQESLDPKDYEDDKDEK